jgi:hypothetical protein
MISMDFYLAFGGGTPRCTPRLATSRLTLFLLYDSQIGARVARSGRAVTDGKLQSHIRRQSVLHAMAVIAWLAG